MNKKQIMSWFVVRKTMGDADAQTGGIIDCVQASSLDVAFEWAMGKWAEVIGRSHDAEKGGGAPCYLSVWPMAPKREPAVSILRPSQLDIDTFAPKPRDNGNWPFGFGFTLDARL